MNETTTDRKKIAELKKEIVKAVEEYYGEVLHGGYPTATSVEEGLKEIGEYLETPPSFTTEEKAFVKFLINDSETTKKIGTLGQETLEGLLNKMK